MPLTAELQRYRYGKFLSSTTHKRNNGEMFRIPFPGGRVNGKRAEFSQWLTGGLMSWSVPGSFCHHDSQCCGKIKAVGRYITTKETVWCWFDLGWKRQVLENEKELHIKIKSSDFKGKTPKAIPGAGRMRSWLRVLASCSWLLKEAADAFDGHGHFKLRNPSSGLAGEKAKVDDSSKVIKMSFY